MEIKDEWIELNAYNYFIRHITPLHLKAEVVLVFLHDALGSADQWKSFPNQLAQICGLKAIVIDRLGHGKSSAMPLQIEASYLHQEAHQTLPQLMDRLEIQKPILIGHSDGGTIGLLYASKYRVTGLVSMAGHVLNEIMTKKAIESSRDNAEDLVKALEKYHGSKAQVLYRRWYDTWLHPAFANFSIIEILHFIKDPILVIQNELDPYGSLEQVESIMTHSGSKDKVALILKGNAHAPHLSDSNKVLEAIKKFTKRIV